MVNADEGVGVLQLLLVRKVLCGNAEELFGGLY